MLAAMCSTRASTRSHNGAAVALKALNREAIGLTRRAVPETKKRHVESMTRLPTKRLATACWDFIVVKRGWLQTAPLLDFSSLQCANTKIHQQVIHKCLWMSWG